MQVGVNAYRLYHNFNALQNVEITAIDENHEFACVQLHNTLMGRGDIIRETTLEVQDSIKSPFLSSFNTGDCLNIPVAHNEGNYIANNELLKELKNNGQIALKYKKSSEIETDYNPNGSLNDIAGILSKNGRVLGMMPHPERSINSLHGGTDGLKFLTKSIEQIVG